MASSYGLHAMLVVVCGKKATIHAGLWLGGNYVNIGSSSLGVMRWCDGRLLAVTKTSLPWLGRPSYE